MNKFRNVPALITLLAGFITSVIMIVHRYSLVNFMWVLIAVMAGFYICGVLIRFALNKVVQNKEEKENTTEAEEQEQKEGQESVEE